MVNYSQGKIYKIVCNITGKMYIGSTCKPTLASRLSEHKSSYKRFLKGKRRNVTSFEILEGDNYDIVLLENYSCESKDQLHARERFYIESLDCVNKVIPNRTKEETLAYSKQSYIINREARIEHSKKYHEDHKEKDQMYYRNYYQENKEAMVARQREYDIAHKNEISLKKKMRYANRKLINSSNSDINSDSN